MPYCLSSVVRLQKKEDGEDHTKPLARSGDIINIVAI